MKSFRALVVVVLIVVVLLGGLSLAMAAVTAPLKFPEAQAELRARAGTVEYQRSGSTDWVTVDEAAEVFPGDSVRTGDNSDADINLYDQGVLHLAENSLMTLEEALWDASQPQVFEGEIFLEAGNLWSRVFDFVSPESNFEVRTSSTVATVRGTTFWVGALPGNESRVYVDNHAVEVRSLTGSGTLDVSAGEMVRLDRVGQRANLQFVEPPTGQDLEIIEKYREWDQEFEAEVLARQLEFAHQVRKFDPESSLYNFQRLSERVRLALTANDEKREALRERFMAGRVLDAYIEFAERNDLARTRVLLQHAQEFGGEDIRNKPLVRRAVMYFGRTRGEVPAQLEEAFKPFMGEREVELINEQPQVTPEVQGESVEFSPKLRDYQVEYLNR